MNRQLRDVFSTAAMDMALAEAQTAMRELAERSAGLLPSLAANMAPTWLVESGDPAEALAELGQYDDYAMAPDAAGFERCVEALACQAAFGRQDTDRARTALRSLHGVELEYAAPLTGKYVTAPLDIQRSWAHSR